MKKNIIAFSLLVASLHYSQVKTELEVFHNSRGDAFHVTNTNFKAYSGIDGTPYINEKFMPISVEGYNSKLPDVRYNAYEDEMEFMQDNKLNYVIKSGDMRIQFITGNKTYFLTNYILDSAPVNGYLAEIINGSQQKFGFYKKESVQIVEYNNNTTNSYLKTRNPYFERQKDIYLISIDGKLQKLPKTIKEIKTLVGEEKTEEYIKKNKLRINNEQDLIKFLEFINK